MMRYAYNHEHGDYAKKLLGPVILSPTEKEEFQAVSVKTGWNTLLINT